MWHNKKKETNRTPVVQKKSPNEKNEKPQIQVAHGVTSLLNGPKAVEIVLDLWKPFQG